MPTLLRVFVSGLLFALASFSFANEIAGKVVGVMDGDTIEVVTPTKVVVRVRLAGIDAPEKKQAFGTAAKQKLSDLVYLRDVVVNWHKKDRYGRVVGKVMVNGVDVDLLMIEAGFAWHYRNYMKEQTVSDRLSYMSAETTARAQRMGLWDDANPVPPWEFRRPH